MPLPYQDHRGARACLRQYLLYGWRSDKTRSGGRKGTSRDEGPMAAGSGEAEGFPLDSEELPSKGETERVLHERLIAERH